MTTGTEEHDPSNLWMEYIKGWSDSHVHPSRRYFDTAIDNSGLNIGGDGTRASRMIAHRTRSNNRQSLPFRSQRYSIPKMSGIIAGESHTDRGVAQLRNTILHTFVNSGNAQVRHMLDNTLTWHSLAVALSSSSAICP